MYTVYLLNSDETVQLHPYSGRRIEGTIKDEIGSIPSFTCTLYPDNPGYGKIEEMKSEIAVFSDTPELENIKFYGRVLLNTPSMDESGIIKREITCEGLLGYLQDSMMTYAAPECATIEEYIRYVISEHNNQFADTDDEGHKIFQIGEITDALDDDYISEKEVSYDTAYDNLKADIIDSYGGEFVVGIDQLSYSDRVITIDYVEESGETKDTVIKLGRNLKSITSENDITSIISRLIPLGEKQNDTEERLTIKSVNNGCIWIDDEDAIKKYGVIAGKVEYDDVTKASNLLKKGKAYLKSNNVVVESITLSAYDLSTIGLDFDEFALGNTHRIMCDMIGLDDYYRITSISIDINSTYQSTLGFGSNSYDIKKYNSSTKTTAANALLAGTSANGSSSATSSTIKKLKALQALGI